MRKMPCSITDDVLSDPEHRLYEPELTRAEEMSLRLESMSNQIKAAMRKVDEHQVDLRKDLMAIQNGIFLTHIDLDDLDS